MNLATWDETCDSHYPARSEAFNTKIGLSIGAVTGAVPCAMNYRISGAVKMIRSVRRTLEASKDLIEGEFSSILARRTLSTNKEHGCGHEDFQSSYRSGTMCHHRSLLVSIQTFNGRSWPVDFTDSNT